MEQAISPSISVHLLAAGASVPIGTRGLVRVIARNDMTTTQKLGISWMIRDPDGLIPVVGGEYFIWEEWPNTGPGSTHEFVNYERFDINKPGTWTISIALLMNQDDPVEVASYDGVLCVVEEEVFAGTIVSKELVYDGITEAIPVY